VPDDSVVNPVAAGDSGRDRHYSSASLLAVSRVVVARWRVTSAVLGGMLVLCFLYCLIAPNEYEARAQVALRIGTSTSLNLEGADGRGSADSGMGQTQLETVASAFRSDQLAWKVILDEKLYRAAAFRGRFAEKFPNFKAEAPGTEAEGYLLDRFSRRLHVHTLPRTLVLEIRFRSRDPALSAAVVTALIRAYGQEEANKRVDATEEATRWLRGQLAELKTRADSSDQRLALFQKKHGILIAPATLPNGQSGDVEHTSALLEVDELGRQLVTASAGRIEREAEYRAAVEGDPELVLASDDRLMSESGGISTAAFRQIHLRHSELEQEQALLSGEHGPNFPRLVEISDELNELDRQLGTERSRLRERFRSAWRTAVDREQMIRKSLEKRTGEGQRASAAATEYEAMRREADSSRELYVRIQGKAAEAQLAAGVYGADIWVVDGAHPPAKPVTPDMPVYMAITLFVGLWAAVGVALYLDSLPRRAGLAAGAIVMLLLMGTMAQAQAPTPSTSGLPTGVARIPAGADTRVEPNAKDAPIVWGGSGAKGPSGQLTATPGQVALMPAPIGVGDQLDVSEFHTPEFHSVVRVAATGIIRLPMVNEVRVEGMSETEAADAIATALIAGGMLKHPQVFVQVTAYAGLDVSVLGEVTRPGVYPFTVHHRLLDLISAASGLSVGAGAVVNIFHRDDPGTPHSVVLDPSGANNGEDHNPELAAGDTIQVSRAGLVYVVGDVIRPGGFTVDPAQELTVLQAVSLAWGPSQNAALQKALLIREQKGGRIVTTLNLRRMLRGQDPDLPIRERDILFVPDSAAKNLINRTMESVVQSVAGVSIYAGLVYSQRF